MFLLWLVGNPGPALAHAFLQRAHPAQGVVLAEPPLRIRLEFSETVEAEFNVVAVFNSKGFRMDSGDSQVDINDKRIVEMPLPTLSPGVYTVVWRVISADGHPIDGAFAFGVGSVSVSQADLKPKTSVLSRFVVFFAGVAHATALGGLLLLAGLPVFFLLVLRPAARRTLSEEGEDTWASFDHKCQASLLDHSKIALALAMIASAVSLVLQTVRLAGEPSAIASFGLIGRLLSHTRFGQVWSLRVAGLALVAVGLWWIGRRGNENTSFTLRWYILSAAASLLLITPALSGHPAAAGGWTAVYLIIADWLHLLAAAPWFAGLWYFAHGLRKAVDPLFSIRSRTMLTATLVARFPRVAVPSVLVLASTGLAGAIKHIPSWEGVFQTSYGQAILTKIGLLILVLLIAASHHFVFHARIKGALTSRDSLGDDATRLLTRFQRMVALETGLVVAILFVAGLLVNFPPAEASLAGRARFFQGSREVSGHRMNLKVSPARVGFNTVEFAVDLPANRQEIDLQVTMTAGTLEQNMSVQEVSLRRIAPGQYRGDRVLLGPEGRWEITIVGVLDDREFRVSFQLQLAPERE